MYSFICFLLIATGGGILFFFNYMEHSGKAVIAIILIALGLFLFIFRGKGAQSITDAIEFIRHIP